MKKRNEDFDAELKSHLEMAKRDRVERGASEEDALAATRREFGNAELVKETVRDQWGWRWIEDFADDVRYGLRAMRKSAGFAIVAVLTLALGIGANVAIFSAVYSALLRPLPFKNSDRLLVIRKQNVSHNWNRNLISAPEFLAWRSEAGSFEDVAAYANNYCVLKSDGGVEEDSCQVITSNLFSVLGVTPAQGRTFLPEEDRADAPRAAILSYGLWQRQFAGDPGILGKAIEVNGESFTVVGVMPASFLTLYNSPYENIPELWVSGIALSPDQLWNNYAGVGRLKSGASITRAQAELDAISGRLQQALPQLQGWQAQLMTLRYYSGDVRPELLVLMGAVVLVLLIACTNVANLLLARATGRTSEYAVRTALGAGRGRLVRQLLTETLLISLGGEALGIALACVISKGMIAVAPQSFLNSTPGLANAAVEWKPLLFASLVALVTTVLAGLAPAVQSGRLGVAAGIKEGGRGALETAKSRRVRSGLVVSEIALAMVLLVGAGLLVRTLVQLERVQFGFNPANVVTFRVPLTGEAYRNPSAVTEFWKELLARVEALPGVESASVSWGVPLDNWNGLSFNTAEDPNPPATQMPDANYLPIGPDYFRTMQVPLLRGRVFNNQDTKGHERVVIINEELARRHWPGQDALGKRLRIEPDVNDAPWLTVVGVVGSVLTRGPEGGLYPEVYVPYRQEPILAPRHLAVRTSPSVQAASIEHAVAQVIQSVDKNVPVADVRTMEEIVLGTRTNQRMLMALLGSLAGLALVLAAMGIYSVLSYTVAQKTREIGVRVALGAQKRDVLRLVVGSGAWMAALGIAIGIGVAMLLRHLMASLVYGVSTNDGLTFCSVAVILGGAAFLACYIPARRAARLDPIVALSYE